MYSREGQTPAPSEKPIEGAEDVSQAIGVVEYEFDIPADQIAEGFQPVMPGNYGQQLSEEQLNALVAYITSLGGQE